MMNLFVTYRCNLACPYCFARDFARTKPGDMTRQDFQEVLDWAVRAGQPALGLLGGEPTLHPDLVWMTRRAARAGVAPVVFTNGLCGPELAGELAENVRNFVVNFNGPSLLTPAQAAVQQATLERLAALGARITFSKNFSSRNLDYAALLEGAARHGVRAVRYDISRPGLDGRNDHFRLGDTAAVSARIVSFVRACEALGIRTGLDCCAALCDFPEPDRAYLERVSMKFRGVCHPSVDVHPDLSASYCLPLGGLSVERVTAFPGWDALMGHFCDLARPLRERPPAPQCAGCALFGRRCQGGCLALRDATGLRNAPSSLTTGAFAV